MLRQKGLMTNRDDDRQKRLMTNHNDERQKGLTTNRDVERQKGLITNRDVARRDATVHSCDLDPEGRGTFEVHAQLPHNQLVTGHSKMTCRANRMLQPFLVG